MRSREENDKESREAWQNRGFCVFEDNGSVSMLQIEQDIARFSLGSCGITGGLPQYRLVSGASLMPLADRLLR